MKAKKASASTNGHCDNLVRLITLLAIVWCLALVANSAINRSADEKTFHGVESLKYGSFINKAESIVQKLETEIISNTIFQTPSASESTQSEKKTQVIPLSGISNNLRSETLPGESTKPQSEKDITRVEDPEVLKEDQEEKKAEEILMKNAEQRKKGLFPKGAARDAIFALAVDTDPKNLAVFIKSLKEVSNAVLYLFISSPVSPIVKQMATTNSVKLKEFQLESLPESISKYHPSSVRWVMFNDFLEHNEKIKIIYKRVWLLDVRDTYFQDDPFQYINPDQSNLHVFQGVQDKTIRECGWNSGWIKDCFGESMVNQIGKENIICSGVTGGTMDMIADYIQHMAEIIGGSVLRSPLRTSLDKHNVPTKGITFPKCERNGVDQGVHNVLIHNHVLTDNYIQGNMEILLNSERGGPYSTGEESVDQIFKWNNENGYVANMQARMNKIKNNIVYNAHDKKIAIVHQYDRFPDFQMYLFGKYVDWVRVDNLADEWGQTPDCQNYNYQENIDWFKGICDLQVKGGATSAASCCRYCNDNSRCKGFTFFSGQCFMKTCNDRGMMKNIRLNNAVSAAQK